MKSFLENRHQHVNGDGDPDLRLVGVLARAVEGLDPQVLLDPFEEKFDLPTALVDLRDGECRHRETVGDENETLGCLGVHETNAHVIQLGLHCAKAGFDISKTFAHIPTTILLPPAKTTTKTTPCLEHTANIC